MYIHVQLLILPVCRVCRMTRECIREVVQEVSLKGNSGLFQPGEFLNMMILALWLMLAFVRIYTTKTKTTQSPQRQYNFQTCKN